MKRRTTNNGMRFLATHCPLCRQRISFAHALDIDQPLARWEIRCQDGAWVHFKSDKDGLEHLVFMTGVTMPAKQEELL